MFQSKAADAALVRTAQEGNRAAFGALYERYKPMVHGILLAHVPYADAEDLMQTVFVQAMQRLPGLRDAEAFGGWLAAIARNLAFDYHRRRKNLVEIGQLDESQGSRIPSRTHSCEAEAALDAIR